MTLAKIFTAKEFLELFHDNKDAKDGRLEADPDLEKNMTVC